MVVENIMYFALGLFAAGLGGIAVGSAIWNRAVRLTKRRIEAATPVTLTEFRADKDRLRAEHAIGVRKLELRIEALRETLASRIMSLDAATTELAALRAERDEQYDAIGALQVREQELVARIRDLERDGASLAARLRQADVDLSDIDETLIPESAPQISAEELSGDYRNDVEDLLTALSIERQRNSYLEEQAKMLLARLEKKKKSGAKDEAIAMLRDTLSTDPQSEARVALRKAEARIAGAESRLSALLSDDAGQHEKPAEKPRHLAQDLSEEDLYNALRGNVEALEETAMEQWGTERFDAQSLRARLEAIASDVSQLVYAADADDKDDLAESLFDKVRKFAADGMDVEELSGAAEPGGAVSDRMAALRDMQVR